MGMAIVGSRKQIRSVTLWFYPPTITPEDLKDADDVVQPGVWARTVRRGGCSPQLRLGRWFELVGRPTPRFLFELI